MSVSTAKLRALQQASASFTSQAREEDEGGGGLFGIGLGPDISLPGIGFTTALQEIGGGLSALANVGYSMLTPAKDGPGVAEFSSQFSKGMLASVAGTIDTFNPADWAGIDALSAGHWTKQTFGEEYEGKNFFEKAGDRGIVPALIEDVGNIAIGAGAATKVLGTGAKIQKASGATASAARLEAMAKNPLLQAARSPYRVTARTFRQKYLIPSEEALLTQKITANTEAAAAGTARQAGIDVPELPDDTRAFDPEAASLDMDVPEDATLARPIAETFEETRPGFRFLPPETRTRLTQSFAKVEDKLKSREIRVIKRDIERTLNMDRATMSRNAPTIQSATEAAQELMRSTNMTRREASRAIMATMEENITGIGAIYDDLSAVAPKSVLAQYVNRSPGIPDDIPHESRVRIEENILKGVESYRQFNEELVQTLGESRKSFLGLEGIHDDAVKMTVGQQRRLKSVQKTLERVDRLDNQRLRQRNSIGSKVQAARDQVARDMDRIAENNAGKQDARRVFDKTRSFGPQVWKGEQGIVDTSADIARRLQEGEQGVIFKPHENRHLTVGADSGHVVGLGRDVARIVPLEDLQAQDVERIISQFQDVFDNPDVSIHAWVDGDQRAHIAPVEHVQDFDDAFLKAGARQEEQVLNVFDGTTKDVPLKNRPDIAQDLLDNHTQFSRVSKELRKTSDLVGVPEDQVSALMDLSARMAARGVEAGTISRIDDAFKDISFAGAQRPASPDRVIRDLAKRFDGEVPDVATEITQELADTLGMPFDEALISQELERLALVIAETTGQAVNPGQVPGLLDSFMTQTARQMDAQELSAAVDNVRESVSQGHVIDDALDTVAETGLSTRWPRVRNALNNPDLSPAQKDRLISEFTATEVSRINTDAPRPEMLEVLRTGIRPSQHLFEDKVLAEFLPMNTAGKQVIRVFEGADFSVLASQNAQAMKKFLGRDDMRTLTRQYGIKQGKWTKEAGTKLGQDFTNYLYTADSVPAGLRPAFNKIRQVLADTWNTIKTTFHSSSISPQAKDLFDNWLEPGQLDAVAQEIPGLELPAPATGTMAQQAARRPAFADTPSEAFKVGKQGAEQVARVKMLDTRNRTIQKTMDKNNRTIQKLEEVLETGRTPAELEQRKLLARAERVQSKVFDELDQPSVSRAPRRWQPLYDAIRQLNDQKDLMSPELANAIGELPQTLSEIQQLAMQKGFDPVHIREFSAKDVRKLNKEVLRVQFGRGQLVEQAAGTRKMSTQTLRRRGQVEDSLEALVASVGEVVQEKYSNQLITEIEGTLARRWKPEYGDIPEGWVAWDPIRVSLLQGEKFDPNLGKIVRETSPGVQSIVPERSLRILDKDMSTPGSGMFLDALNKITNPWRKFTLLLSPGWYARNLVGNTIMAQAAGVRARDWKSAWDSYKNSDAFGPFADIPFVQGSTILGAEGLLHDTASLIPQEKGFLGRVKQARAEARQAPSSAPLKEKSPFFATSNVVQERLLRANAVIDEFARAAVFKQGKRLNMTDAEAWKRAQKSLVDYQDLGPLERKYVRTAVPFYSWQKGILKVTGKHVLDNPGAANVMMQLGHMQREYVADLLGVSAGEVPDYYMGLTGSGHNLQSWNPFADAAGLTSPGGIGRSLSPIVELMTRDALGAPQFVFGADKQIDAFGNVIGDVDIQGEFFESVFRSPFGSLLQGNVLKSVGLAPVDKESIVKRIDRARSQGAFGEESILPAQDEQAVPLLSSVNR